MTLDRLDKDIIRRALESIPDDQAEHGASPPEPGRVYVVPNHERALASDTAIVVGDRGTGKSFWSSALGGQETRLLISKQLRRLKLDSMHVSWGFAPGVGGGDYPSSRTLEHLVENGFKPETIWRAVILYQLCREESYPEIGANWTERVRFVSSNPEAEEHLLQKIDRSLKKSGQRHLIVFDGLDRLGESGWASIRPLLQGLLKACLDYRTLSAIRLKLFMRPDMWDDRKIWAFPDASKLHHGRVELTWRRNDLYGLLWHYLGNDGRAGSHFRKWCGDRFNLEFEEIKIENSKAHVYVVPKDARSDEDIQKEMLNAIASQFMGRDRRRGRTYTWLPTHLADAKGQVSPRSFMLALKHAAHASEDRNASDPLHFEGIKRGVQEASQVRLQELREDYQWIDTVLEALRGMSVPCTIGDMTSRWKEKKVIEAISKPPSDLFDRQKQTDDKPYLPPHALEDRDPGKTKEEGLIDALIEIGVINRLSDGRLNVPDLFRVAAGIGRRGGVRPMR